MPSPIQKPKQCMFCTSNIKYIDYKNAELLKRYLNPQGKILPRKKTTVCAKHQRLLTDALKRARILALIPFTTS
jgi:small subunit ribosomal protein S18